MPSARAFCVISRANSASSPARFSAIVTAASFADFVTTALIASSTDDGLAGSQAEFCRRLLGRVLGNLELGVEPDLAGLEPLEQQIERHDLGERCGMTQRVGVGRVQDFAAVAVDHN